MSAPLYLLGIFQKLVAGDDSLLALAARRFHKAGLGAEIYPANVEELEHLLRLAPGPDLPATVHLPRHLNMLQATDRAEVLGFAAQFAGRVYGLTLHDQPEAASSREQLIGAYFELEARLAAIPRGPTLFVEYASGLDPEVYAGLLRALAGAGRVSGCVDIGHIALAQSIRSFARLYPGEDPFALRRDPGLLAERLPDVLRAADAGRDRVVELARELVALGKPLHFHLHDTHPLWSSSSFGMSDHMSFLAQVELPRPVHGRSSVPPIFGPAGLGALLRAVADARREQPLSFTLEIHPGDGRAPLGSDDADLFRHWTDHGNAERMNDWLQTLERNAEMLRATVRAAGLAST